MKTIKTSYGIILKKARKAKGFTQEQIAELLNVSVTTYQSWEAGLYKADEYALLKLEEILEDYTLSIRYLQAYSPIWQAKAKPLLAAIEIKNISEKLAILLPNVVTFIDLSAQMIV